MPNANIQNPSTKNALPKTPKPQTLKSVAFHSFAFVRGIQTVCRAVCMENQGTPSLRFCTTQISMQLPFAAVQI